MSALMYVTGSQHLAEDTSMDEVDLAPSSRVTYTPAGKIGVKVL